MPSTRTKVVFQLADRFASLVAVGLAVALAVIYLVWPQPPESAITARTVWTFSTSLITNFIPVLVVFAGSYFLFARMQDLRRDESREQLAAALAEATKDALTDQFSAIERKVQSTAHLVHDWEQKGVERVYNPDEVATAGLLELQTSTSIRVIGIGNSWLLPPGKQNETLKRLLSNRSGAAIVLMPDPFSPAIVQRYEEDEGKNKNLSLKKLGGRILQWARMREDYPSLKLKVYDRYPMMNVSIYDQRVFASPVLYQARAVEGLTFSFRKHSLGAELYEAHFARIYESGSKEIDAEYLEKVSVFANS